LLNVIGCVTEPSSGWMRLDGEPVYDQRWLRRDLRRLRHPDRLHLPDAQPAAIPQRYREHCRGDGTRRRGVTPGPRAAGALLDYLEVGNRRYALPGALSGGEAQRVAIARALANSPTIILADEPTAPLDTQRAGVVMDLLKRIAIDQQAAVLVVTHDETIFSRFDRLIELRDGRMIGEEIPLLEKLTV
jgi:putative ABC transport system ATP-binding protein